MHWPLPLIFIFAGAAIGSALATPFFCRVAELWGLVDRPDQHRKVHDGAVPLAGGLVLVATAILAYLTAAVLHWQGQIAPNDFRFVTQLFFAATFVAVVGAIDDRLALRGRQKLAAQVVAAGMVVLGGVSINEVSFAGATWSLGVFAGPITALWIVAAINAINLVDGSDGFASSIGVVSSLVIAFLLAGMGRVVECVAAVALAGALLGFLRFNAPPARAFLGDSGSMLVGLVLGVLAIRGSLKEATAVMMAAPASVLAIPLLDVAMAVVRRRLTGRSIFSTDRRHLHHSMQEYGLSRVGMMGVVALLSAVTGVGAILSVRYRTEWPAVVSVFVVVIGLAAARVFGHHEWTLIGKHGWRFLGSFVSSGAPSADKSFKIKLQGRRDWETLWQSVVEFAERMGLHGVQFNVALPAMGEEFHSSWNRGGSQVHDADVWVVEFPLFHGGRSVARLKLIGESSKSYVAERLGDVIAEFRTFEIRFDEILTKEATEVVVESAPSIPIAPESIDVDSIHAKAISAPLSPETAPFRSGTNRASTDVAFAATANHALGEMRSPVSAPQHDAVVHASVPLTAPQS